MTATEIRDQRRQSWFWVDERLIKRDGAAIGVNGIAVYCLLASYADNNTQRAFPGINTLAKKLGVSSTTVREAIETLEVNGWIAVEKRYNSETKTYLSNIYTLLNPPTTAAVVVPQRRKGTTAAVSELDSPNHPQPSGEGKQNKRKGVDKPEWNALFWAHTGETYVSGVTAVPSEIRGLLNRQYKAVMEVGGSAQDVVDYYTPLRDKGLTPTRNVATLQLEIKKLVDARQHRSEQAAAMLDNEAHIFDDYERMFGDQS